MHSKIRTAIKRLTELQTRAAATGSTAYARGQALGTAAYAKGRSLSASTYRRALTLARARLQDRRSAVAGIIAAGLLSASAVGGTVALVNAGAFSLTGSSVTGPAAAAPNAAAREGAAGRADRAERPDAAATQPGAEKEPAAWVNPLPGARMTSCFGPRWGGWHEGIDFAAPAGTKIHAVGAGRVIGAGWLYAGYGMSVMIDHGNGYLSHYAHASQVLVKAGQWVEPGQAIALEGSTGDSTGPHLHFEIHKGLWNQIEPAQWLRDRGVKVGC